MSRTLVLPDELYTWLETAARQRGLPGVAELLEAWQAADEQREQRRRTVEQIDDLRAHLLATYGQMPDSVELLREDRAR